MPVSDIPKVVDKIETGEFFIEINEFGELTIKNKYCEIAFSLQKETTQDMRKFLIKNTGE